MKKYFFIITLTITTAIAIASLDANYLQKKSIMKSREFLKPIIWPYNLEMNLTYNQIIQGKIEHPLQIGTVTVKYFLEAMFNNKTEYIKRGEALLHILDNYAYKKEKSDSVIYLYNQDHGSLKAKKWWSGMANSSIALAYLYGYEITKKEKYKISAIKAINGVIQSIKENGSAVKLDHNSTWYLEYAENKSNIKNSKFVLNGFQYSLLVLKIFQEKLKSQIYNNAYEKGINAFKKFSKEFYYPDNSWIYYMKNPLTIESVHYAIFDNMLLKSLAMYDKKNRDFLQNELRKRKNILKKHYNLEKYSDGTYLFSAIGVPHPYWIDLRPTELRIYYNNSHQKKIEITPKNFNQKISKRAFIFIDANESKEIDFIEIFQKHNGYNDKIFTTKNKDIIYVDDNQILPKVIEASKNYLHDAYSDNNNSYIKLYQDKTSKAVIQFILKTPINLWEKKYFLVFINSAIDLDAIRIILFDIEGKTSERYYLPQKSGNNLILLSALGFKNQNINHKIKEIRFYLYAKKNNTKKALINLSKLFYMDSKRALYELLKKNDESNNSLFHFQEKRPKSH